jgi:hypothetical protein
MPKGGASQLPRRGGLGDARGVLGPVCRTTPPPRPAPPPPPAPARPALPRRTRTATRCRRPTSTPRPRRRGSTTGCELASGSAVWTTGCGQCSLHVGAAAAAPSRAPGGRVALGPPRSAACRVRCCLRPPALLWARLSSVPPSREPPPACLASVSCQTHCRCAPFGPFALCWTFWLFCPLPCHAFFEIHRCRCKHRAPGSHALFTLRCCTNLRLSPV